jgi:hypothetical protein
MNEHLKKLLAMLNGAVEGGPEEKEERDLSSWIQVGVLNPESLALFKGWRRERDRLMEEDSVLLARHKAIEAQETVLRREFWSKMYKLHTLPVDKHYTIDAKTNRILMEPVRAGTV